MKIIKRNGSEVSFDKTRIEKAMLKAGKEADNELTLEIAKEIADFIEQEALKEGHSLSVEDIQDLVETELMKHGLYRTAKLFISYWYKRTLLRKGNTTDARILSLIEENNEDVKQENSNKNPTVVSVQRDYMAGEVSKDITRRFLLPPDIVRAHDEGIIHFHDADYFSQHSHNCGASWTRFITSEGVKEFGKCRDGEEVEVLDMYGEWRKATVHKFGRQKLYDITLKSKSCEKVVSFTSNHRWILKDGTVTESLKIGDVLWGTRETHKDWKPSTIREYNMFALGLVIGDGCDIRKGFGGVRVRLCGKKTKYSEVLSKCGFKISKLPDSNDLVATASSKWFKKQDFLNGRSWQYLSKEDKNALFRGYFSADGNAYKEASSRRGCSTADDRIAQMIRDISPFAGFHLIKEREIIHDTQYKKNARLINFTFIVKQEKEKCCWTVVEIKERRHGKESSYQDVWCVVEPVTHSFTLEGGVVTGNCFSERTRFITKKGVKPFSDFKDGDKVEVLDRNGEWREATVHLYGKQQMWNVTLERTGQEKDIVCTSDHRWILQDGQVTSCLRAGDILYKSPRDVTGDSWKVRSMTPVEGENAIQDAWCVVEPETHTFTLEGPIVTGNCDLINLDDMLQNGTVISGTRIDRPHSFSTACNIATQIIAQVASCQYGGQSITLSHLAPFVQVSREKIKRELETSLKETGIQATEYQLHEMIEKRVRDEIKKGVQTIQYQVITLMTTNGQAPFITVFMYLNEVPEGQIRDDLALIIEEVLKQRKQGVKNESGAWITPAFPKLIYVLQPDNIVEGSRYFYLTRLAAECTAKRMVPDYISEKKMLELKVDKNGNGNCYPCMGCVDGKEVVSYKLHGLLYSESIERMWERLSDYYELKTQSNGIDFFLDTPGVEIYDQKKGFVKNYRIIKNKSNDWMNIQFSSGRSLTCTVDHPFETENRGVVLAKDLLDTDLIAIDRKSVESENGIDFNVNKAWLFGFLLCDSTYYDTVMSSIALKGEDDIEKSVRDIIKLSFGLDVKTIERHRGAKGEYKDLLVLSDETDKLTSLKCRLIQMFEGKAKRDRHISPEVFRWSRESRLAFLAGMIDADGYVNNSHSITTVQLGSTNKELALQQMNLIQSLGMEVSIYQNHYRGRFHENSIRYLNEFTPSKELIDSIHCKKKQDHLGNTERTNESVKTKEFVSPTSIKMIDREAFSYDVTTESEHFTVSGIYSHNCRSFLTPYVTENGEPKYYGRFNQGVVTLNLVDVALSSGKDFDKFWQLMSERLELCHRALRTRHERLLGTSSDVAPILWQNGALARLPKGEKIDKLLFGGYSTISLGYAGLYECVYYMTGKSHTDEEAKPFALSVMKALNDACKRWKTAENIDYSVYGTPLESTTYKFAKCLKKRFGVIPGVTDRNYITNSYHVHVSEKIDAFTKLSFESEFQELSPGGAISYVEVPNMENNIEAVLALLKHIYQNIMYAELNTKSDFCQVCSYSGEIQIVEDSDGKLVWECPRCGNRDQTKMNVARRTCGYIGTQYWNQGRTQEIRERVLHL